MKKRFMPLLLLTLISVLFLSTTAEAVTTNQWYTKASSFKKIEKAAKKKNKPYILFFYTDWCGYCKKMNKNYLSKEKIQHILSKYYRIKINPEKGEAEGNLAQKKGVQGFPDFRVVHPSGISIKVHPFKRSGSLTVKEFIQELEAALKGES
ncbi:MAG: thioredoxin family protein [Candidatus Electrothrix aestuarii]|uniref:Thioredoxin family protein n=1 Tax=Candidatus Electrothrix aestuarii TaxID=3062594 RepID=A0AAU8M1X7_9BACT|nr:thioredoxin family protein [Candidatus Electrothrix aestuarii]